MSRDHQDGGDWDPTGTDLGRSLVAAARGASGSPGAAEAAGAPFRRRRRSMRGQQGAWSGAGPDGRDPRPLTESMSDVVADQGWSDSLSLHAITGQWPEIVGEDVARHTTPSMTMAGVLVITCSSSAWAAQLEMLLPRIRERIAAWSATQTEARGVPTEIRVVGPHAPTWRHGPRVVRGRGPRDTYG